MMFHAASMRGFTLIELLVVLVILGLVTGIAAPALVAANDRARLNDAAVRLHDDLRRARSFAVMQGDPVTLDARTALGDNSIHIAGARPLTFYPDGSATSMHMTLALGAHRRFLTVDWLTGRATLAE